MRLDNIYYNIRIIVILIAINTFRLMCPLAFSKRFLANSEAFIFDNNVRTVVFGTKLSMVGELFVIVVCLVGGLR